jgi:hypothetical protein
MITLTIPCSTPGCSGSRKIHKNSKRGKKPLPFCLPCLKARTLKYQRDLQRSLKWGGLDPYEIIEVPCSIPGCTTTRKVERRRAESVKYCKAHALSVNRGKVKAYLCKQRGGYHPRKAQPDRPESEKAKWGRTHKCKVCGGNPWPNHFFCPGTCHSRVSKTVGDDETYDMPHVPMSR